LWEAGFLRGNAKLLELLTRFPCFVQIFDKNGWDGRWVEQPVADRLKPEAIAFQVRLRGLLKFRIFLSLLQAGFGCIAPEFHSVGD
jgi:hypothetical protein